MHAPPKDLEVGGSCGLVKACSCLCAAPGADPVPLTFVPHEIKAAVYAGKFLRVGSGEKLQEGFKATDRAR